MRVRLSTDLLTGLLFLALGAFAILYGSRYPIGSAARMGAGYFPRLASAGLLLIGGILVARSFIHHGEAVGTLKFRPVILVLLGTLAFGLLIERAGLVVAGVVLVFAARLAERDFRLFEVSALALLLAASAAAVFRYGLGLPVRLLPF
jgi:Tripartite tricarboxylate transporter TctB family